MTFLRTKRLPLIGGAILILVAALVVAADSGLFGGARSDVLVVDHHGQEGDWRKVSERGRYVSSIIAEKLNHAAYTAPFKIALVEDGTGTSFMQVTGRMVEGSADAFLETIDANDGNFDTVAFDTAGFGLIDEGMSIGKIIRERGLKTVVREGDVCGGIGCLTALVGGVERTIADLPYIGGGHFGIVGEEGMGGNEAARAAQAGVADILNYLRSMGVDPSIVEAMLEAKGGADYRFAAAELHRANVAHRIIR